MMTSFSEPEAHQAIRQVIRNINDAWVNGHAEDIVNWLHEDVVFVHPEFGVLGEGREICAKSYKDFAGQATIHDFKESDPTIHVYGNTAVMTYRFETTYEFDGETRHDAGRDMFVLIDEEDKWKVVWRAMVPLPQED